MTTYEFEVRAKQAVCGRIDGGLGIEEVHVVWMAHLLGSKKCVLMSPRLPNIIWEVTWNAAADEMYLDAYQKFAHQTVQAADQPGAVPAAPAAS